jgi:hypothetical protein
VTRICTESIATAGDASAFSKAAGAKDNRMEAPDPVSKG